MTRPNVLFVVIDTLRADSVQGRHVATPVLDSVAERGVFFEQCIATATMTTPSFAAMLTGCYPMKHGLRGLHGYRLSPDVTTLAEALGAAGYHTRAEVTGPLLPETDVTRGFASSRHRVSGEFLAWRDEVLGAFADLPEPWMGLLHVWEVHNPFRAPPDFRERWDRAGYERVVTAVDEGLAPFLQRDDCVVVVTGDHGEQFPDSRRERVVTWAVRKLYPRLRLGGRARGLDRWLARNTLGHGHAVYEHLVRVPLLVAGPGIPHRVVPDQVRHVDVAPTIAALCGASMPTADGRSLAPLWSGADLPEEPAYVEAGEVVRSDDDPIVCLRTSEWKLVRELGRESLYRVPDETRDLSAEHPAVAETLRGRLDELTSTRVTGSGMTEDEEAVVESHLRDLGYL
ncbi:MAG TPA: sulfatase [Actinomycetota bacterium]|nr:sulfatase [Actinomycetota bacterium]